MKAIDLFCGAGGSTEGLKQAGIEVVLAVDIDETVLKSYSRNHPEVEVWQRDILELGVDELPKVDLIVGSTPCHSFSRANLKTRTCDMSLTSRFIKIVDGYHPLFWVCENVRDVIPHLPCSYKKYARLLNSAHYGTPQSRVRMIAGNYPNTRQTHTQYKMMTLDGLVTDRFVYISDVLPYMKGKWLSDQRRTKLPWTTESYFHTERPSRAILTKPFILVEEPGLEKKPLRYLTTKEQAIIQGFQGRYYFEGNRRQQELQVGNAVPPQIMKAVGLACLGQ